MSRLRTGFSSTAALVALTATAACSTEPEPEPVVPEDTYTFDISPDENFTTYEVNYTIGDLAPGAEDTQCITMRAGNLSGALVRRFRGTLSQGSHHMIAYKSTATEEALVPTPCFGFSGIFDGDHPIFIAQQADAVLSFPTDAGKRVALRIDENQMLRLEMHYINFTPEVIDVTGTLYIDTVPLGTDVVESDLAFWGTPALNTGGTPPSEYIPAHGKGDTGVRFQAALSGTKSFALTTHQHQLGTRMRVWHTDSGSFADLDGGAVADASNWANPPLVLLDPPLSYEASAGKFSPQGLAYRCEWDNPGDTDVYFGESFNDEMCFLWHYYYPSLGFQVCTSGLCLFQDEIDNP